LDLSGDTGAIGRFHALSTDVNIDLKGNQYKGVVRPSKSFLVINETESGLKVEGIVDDLVPLCFQGSVLDGLGGGIIEGEDLSSDEDEDENERSTINSKQQDDFVEESDEDFQDPSQNKKKKRKRSQPPPQTSESKKKKKKSKSKNGKKK